MNTKMKISYKQKLYFSILLVFLIFFNVGIMAIATIQNTKNLNMQKETHIQQSNIIIQKIVEDINIVISSRPQSIPLMMQNEGAYLKFNNILFQMLESDNDIVFSSHTSVLEQNNLTSDKIISEIIEINDNKTLLVSTQLKQEYGSYKITLGYDIQWFFDDWDNTISIIIILSLCFSFIIALILYFAINKLTKPLEEIAVLSSKFGEGDFSVRIKNTSNDELGTTAKNFNTMADKLSFQIESLQNINKEKQQLVDDISHEMRTPLTAISGYVQYMQSSVLSEKEYFETLEVINKQALRMQELSEGVLSFASLRGDNNDEIINLESVLEDVYNSYIIKAKNQNTNLNFIYNFDFNITANKVLIESLIGNLIDNSLNANFNIENSFINLTMNKNKIIIEDNGIGMDKETIKKIFTPFFRADKSRSRKSGGAGLGASLCKEIADKYNIKISYQSKLNNGTTVTLDFTS